MIRTRERIRSMYRNTHAASLEPISLLVYVPTPPLSVRACFGQEKPMLYYAHAHARAYITLTVKVSDRASKLPSLFFFPNLRRLNARVLSRA